MSYLEQTANILPRRSPVLLGCACVVLSILSGCERKETQQPAAAAPENAADAATKQLSVYTTFYPTTYFTQRIAGDAVKITCAYPSDADPAFWTPDDETVTAFQGADLVVVNGASFEKGLSNVTLPESRLVDTAKPLAGELITLKDAVKHSHGPQGAHSHEGIDGHTWLDPINDKIQAEVIKKALIERLPNQAEKFEQGYAALAADLDAMDAGLKTLAGKLRDRILLCSHPAYNYVGRRYGWNLKTYHLDPEEMPSDATFIEIKNFLADHPARIMLWESEPAAEIADRMTKELGLKNIVYSPCETLDKDEIAAGANFISVMNGNIQRLEAALGD